MKKTLLAAAAAVVLLSAIPKPAFAVDPGATAAIDKATHEWLAAWNAHDAKRMAAVWAPDGDLVNPFDRVAKGRAEIEKLFVEEQTGPMKASTYKIDKTAMRQIGSVVVVDWDSMLTGIVGPDGKAAPPFPHHVTLLFVRRGGNWMLESARAYVFAPMPPPAK
jgi:uncharacterized protein (TIGR02246 family)